MIEISKRILILCEDEKSSILYLSSFKKDEKLKRDLSAVSIEIYQPRDNSPLGLVNEAKKKKKQAKRERNPYDQVWIVLDRDGHANIQAACDTAYANKIKIALSVICFEYWVLLHFEKTTKIFKKCDDVLRYIKKNHYPAYKKSDNCYDVLKDKVDVAISNGEWIEEQVKNDIERGAKIYNLGAYTSMHRLVKLLVRPKESLFKN